MQTTTGQLLACLAILSLAIGVLFARIAAYREQVATLRTDLMGLVRLIEYRGANVAEYPTPANLGGWQLQMLASDLRSDFPDYFPPEVGGTHQLMEERHAGDA